MEEEETKIKCNSVKELRKLLRTIKKTSDFKKYTFIILLILKELE
jgi:hypothetical protein